MEPLCPATQRCIRYDLSNMFPIFAEITCNSNMAHLPKCKSCGTHDEYMIHICRCTDPGCNGLFHITVRGLYTWMVETLGSHAVASMVKAIGWEIRSEFRRIPQLFQSRTFSTPEFSSELHFSDRKICCRWFRTRSCQFVILSHHQFFQFHESENVPALFFGPPKITSTHFE